MPRRDWRLRIADILAAIERIRRYTDRMDEAAFVQDDLATVWQTATVDVPALARFS